jgi:cytochrome c biogenesis protein
LVYKDLTFYQTDWTLVGLRFSNNDKTFQLPLIPSSNAGNKVWLTWLPTETNNTNIMGQTVIINSYKGTIYIYDMEGLLIKSIDINDSVLEKNYKLIDFLSSTGLEIKSDPGVLYIYIGFGFLMISTLLSYISFSQVWTISNKLSEEKKLTIFAKTNRNKVSLNVEIFKIIN